MPIDVVKVDEDGTTETVSYPAEENKLFPINDAAHAQDQKLRCVHLKSGGRQWFLDGMEIPRVLGESAVFRLLFGKRAQVTITLEVLLEFADEDERPDQP